MENQIVINFFFCVQYSYGIVNLKFQHERLLQGMTIIRFIIYYLTQL